MANSVVNTATLTAKTDDDGSGIIGSVVDKQFFTDVVYTPVNAMIANSSGIGFGGEVRERNRSVAMGDWQDRAFNAANYTVGGSLSFTANSSIVSYDRYSIVGKTLFWQTSLANFTITGTGTGGFSVAIPGGYTANGSISITGVITNSMNAEAWRDSLLGQSHGSPWLGVTPLPAFATANGAGKYFYIDCRISIQ